MGPAHCTSGAIYCVETSSTLAWGRKVPSLHGVPRGGSTRVLPVERLCTSREDLRTLLPFHPNSYLAAAAENEIAKQELHTTHYTTALGGASHRPVFSHHTTRCSERNQIDYAVVLIYYVRYADAYNQL